MDRFGPCRARHHCRGLGVRHLGHPKDDRHIVGVSGRLPERAAVVLFGRYPSPLRGGCVGDLWSPFLEPERRCFASAMCEATVGWGPFLYYPHPGSLRLASTSRASFARLGPRKGEGKEKQGRLWTALSCLAIWVAEEILRTLRIFREIRTDADASGKRTALPG